MMQCLLAHGIFSCLEVAQKEEPDLLRSTILSEVLVELLGFVHGFKGKNA